MPVTPEMPWRSLPKMSREEFVYLLRDSPLASESVAIHDALGADLAFVAYLILLREQGPGLANDFAQAMHNPWLMRPRDAEDDRPAVEHERDGWFLKFKEYRFAAIELAFRLTNPDYKGGVYARTTTLLELNEVYAPKGDGANNPVARTDAMVADANELIGGTMPDVVFGRVPKPARILNQVVEKPEGRGWAKYGPRDELLGFYLHNVLGRARWTGQYFATFDTRYPDGGHGYNALTDWGVGNDIDGADYDGAVFMWNDPDDGRHRSPYASGEDRTDNLPPYGDGAAMLVLCNRLGLNLNQATEAVEISRLKNGDRISAKCLGAVCDLIAWRADGKAKVPWHQWPKNKHGAQMVMTHHEGGKAACDAGDVCAAVIEGVRTRLQRYQTGEAPPAEPVWVFGVVGMTEQRARATFGAVARPGGRPYQYDPNGAVTREWGKNGAATGSWGTLVSVDVETIGGKEWRFFEFSDSFVVVAQPDGKVRPLAKP